jgi:DNA replication protein DnaC
MNPVQLKRLREHLTRLRLLKSHERLDALLQEAAAKDLSYADFLDQVLSEEVTAKAEKNITMRTSLARFPFVKISQISRRECSLPIWQNSIATKWSQQLKPLAARSAVCCRTGRAKSVRSIRARICAKQLATATRKSFRLVGEHGVATPWMGVDEASSYSQG